MINRQTSLILIAMLSLYIFPACGKDEKNTTRDAGMDVTEIEDASDASTESQIIQVAAGWDHTCALLETGAVRCWGAGSYGRLGYGNAETIGDDEHPGSAGDVNVGGKVIQLAAGGSHTCALLDTGAVRCWGRSEFGQLGYGNKATIGDDEHPASAGDVPVGGEVIQMAAGAHHTCAVLESGSVRCWGWGSSGRLGYGNENNIGDDEQPASAGDVNVGGEVTQLTVYELHTCALLEDGAVRCWGSASLGQLGYGNGNNIGDNESPASAGSVSVGGTVSQLAAGGDRTCALLETGSIRCWGSGNYGRLGYGNSTNIGDDELPSSAGDVNIGGTATQLAAGWVHTCALLETGSIRCWGKGQDNYGQLGYGNASNIGDNESPSSAGDVNVGGIVRQLTAGEEHTCALLETGAVRCWGRADSGRLGYGNENHIGNDEEPSSAGDVQIF